MRQRRTRLMEASEIYCEIFTILVEDLLETDPNQSYDRHRLGLLAFELRMRNGLADHTRRCVCEDCFEGLDVD